MNKTFSQEGGKCQRSETQRLSSLAVRTSPMECGKVRERARAPSAVQQLVHHAEVLTHSGWHWWPQKSQRFLPSSFHSRFCPVASASGFETTFIARWPPHVTEMHQPQNWPIWDRLTERPTCLCVLFHLPPLVLRNNGVLSGSCFSSL